MRIPFAFIKSGVQVFDPATLALTGWWRASYSDPWAPTASAGSSGGAGNLTHGTNPAGTGSAQNGYTPADFNGSSQLLANTAFASAFFSEAAWSAVALIRIETAPAYGSDEYDNPTIFSGTGLGNATIGMSVSADGVSVWHFTGADWVGVTAACGTSAYHLAQAKYDGDDIKLRIDGGSWESAGGSVANVDTAALEGETIHWGSGWNGSLYFEGQLLETMFAATTLSNGDFDNILSYVNARYALSL